MTPIAPPQPARPDEIVDFSELSLDVGPAAMQLYEKQGFDLCKESSASVSDTIGPVQTNSGILVGRVSVKGQFSFTRGELLADDQVTECCRRKVYRVNINYEVTGIDEKWDFDKPLDPGRGWGLPSAVAGALGQAAGHLPPPFMVRFTGVNKGQENQSKIECIECKDATNNRHRQMSDGENNKPRNVYDPVAGI